MSKIGAAARNPPRDARAGHDEARTDDPKDARDEARSGPSESSRASRFSAAVPNSSPSPPPTIAAHDWNQTTRVRTSEMISVASRSAPP